MSFSDPIGDLITRIRNGLAVGKAQVVAPYSKIKDNILRVLKEEGYIRGFEVRLVRPQVKEVIVDLKYYEGKPVIAKIRRVSKPGRRVYFGVKAMPKVSNGLGMSIISTSTGIVSDIEARKRGIGGEVICELY